MSRGVLPVAGPVPHGQRVRVERDGTVEALVGVQVDGQATPAGDREEAVEVGERVVREVRRPSDDVDPEVEHRLDVLVGAVGPGERDQLQVDERAELLAHRDEGPRAAGRLLDGRGAVAAEDVDVAADRRRAGREHLEHLRPGPRGDRLDGHGLRVRAPRLDRRAEVPEGRRGELEAARLVEVGVRLGRGGEQDVAVEVQDVPGPCGDTAAGGQHLRDDLALDDHVGGVAVGQRDTAEQRDGAGWLCAHDGPPEGR